MPTRSSKALAPFAGLFFGDAFHVHRGQLDVLGDGHVWVEVELLEDKADLRPQRVQLRLFIVNLDPVHDELAGGDLLQRVYAPEQGALARAGRADDHHDLALVHREVYILENLKVPEELVHVLKLYDAQCRNLPLDGRAIFA